MIISLIFSLLSLVVFATEIDEYKKNYRLKRQDDFTKKQVVEKDDEAKTNNKIQVDGIIKCESTPTIKKRLYSQLRTENIEYNKPPICSKSFGETSYFYTPENGFVSLKPNNEIQNEEKEPIIKKRFQHNNGVKRVLDKEKFREGNHMSLLNRYRKDLEMKNKWHFSPQESDKEDSLIYEDEDEESEYSETSSDNNVEIKHPPKKSLLIFVGLIAVAAFIWHFGFP